jgi:hypothetical protein
VFVMEGLLAEEEVVGRKEELPGGSLPRVEVEVSKSDGRLEERSYMRWSCEWYLMSGIRGPLVGRYDRDRPVANVSVVG